MLKPHSSVVETNEHIDRAVFEWNISPFLDIVLLTSLEIPNRYSQPINNKRDPNSKVRNTMNTLSRRPMRRLSERITVSLLLVTLFANTVFAAPEATRTAIVTAGEIGRDIRFTYMSSNVGAALGGSVNNLFLLFTKARQETPQLSRIEIVPGTSLKLRTPTPVTDYAFYFRENRLQRLGNFPQRTTTQRL